jgi:D-alanyl-D-alanine carboxypeptidase
MERTRSPFGIFYIAGRPLHFYPGTKFLHEEHTAYNLLALVIEKRTGLPFAAAMERLVFGPFGLSGSGVDDDAVKIQSHMALGYEPERTAGLKRARSIHWSGKAGNASVFTAAHDQARWVQALFRGHALSDGVRAAVLDPSAKVGYGWFKKSDQRFGETAYYMNGRAPGFASFVLYLPRTQTAVVVFSNIYSSATTTIGYDVAALSLGLPYQPFQMAKSAPSTAELSNCTGSFQFGPDFYQANARLTLVANGGELRLLWPSGDASALIPVGQDHFVDRSYWVEVQLHRDKSGRPVLLSYDHFQGQAAPSQR